MIKRCEKHIGDYIWIVRFELKESICQNCKEEQYAISKITVSREKITYLSIDEGEYLVNFEAYWYYDKATADSEARTAKWTIGKFYNEVFRKEVKAFAPAVLK
jgi:hypothetical protein